MVSVFVLAGLRKGWCSERPGGNRSDMNALKLIAVMVLVVVATAVWKSGVLDGIGKRVTAATQEVDSTGFVSIPMPDGMSSQGIVIFAPEDCPSDAAQRARKLASFLSDRHIGYVHSESANYNNLSSQEEVSQVMSVMNGRIPIVYVNGKAKANATPEEVEIEFRRSKSG